MKRPEDFSGIYIHRDRIDMRKGINGLAEIVELENMGKLTGPHLFVFRGRKADTIKVLYWDKTGFALWQKRLEEAKFAWPKKEQKEVVGITAEQFSFLLEGYDVWKMKPFSVIEFTRVC